MLMSINLVELLDKVVLLKLLLLALMLLVGQVINLLLETYKYAQNLIYSAQKLDSLDRF
jgi:hypothetical protein